MKDLIGLEKMKTLSEHNREIKAPRVPFSHVKIKAGVTCDSTQCGTEMLLTDPSKVLASSPRKMRVHCPKCGQTSFFLMERGHFYSRHLNKVLSALFMRRDKD